MTVALSLHSWNNTPRPGCASRRPS
jgi:hypothetical protein